MKICEKTNDPFSVVAEKFGLNGHLPGCLKGKFTYENYIFLIFFLLFTYEL